MIRACWGEMQVLFQGNILGNSWEPTGRDCSGFCVLSCFFVDDQILKLNCSAVSVLFFLYSLKTLNWEGWYHFPQEWEVSQSALNQSLIEWVGAGEGKWFQVGWVEGVPIPYSLIHLRSWRCS